jgi:hypothetical protein
VKKIKSWGPSQAQRAIKSRKKKVIMGQSEYLGAEVWAERPGIRKNLNNPLGKLLAK